MPHLITPMLTGRSTVLMLLFGFVLPGTNARSGMKAPNGTFMKRLLSTSQTEHWVLSERTPDIDGCDQAHRRQRSQKLLHRLFLPVVTAPSAADTAAVWRRYRLNVACTRRATGHRRP